MSLKHSVNNGTQLASITHLPIFFNTHIKVLIIMRQWPGKCLGTRQRGGVGGNLNRSVKGPLVPTWTRVQEVAGGKRLGMRVGLVLVRKGLIRQQCAVGLQLGLMPMSQRRACRCGSLPLPFHAFWVLPGWVMAALCFSNTDLGLPKEQLNTPGTQGRD